jgi:phage terminase large subunit-like protein
MEEKDVRAMIDDALAAHDPRVKCILHTAPKDADPFALDTIKQANPHLDVFMNKTEVLRQAEEARRMPSREAAYRNLVLNQRVEARDPFVSHSVWIENGAEPLPLPPRAPVYGGLDLSSVNDLTALVLVSEDWDVLPTFWLPEHGLAEKARADRVPYDMWARQGHLLTTPGKAITYEFIAHHLRGVFDDYDVQQIAFDRHFMDHLTPWLERAGFTEDELARFKPFGQGFVSMSPALRELETLLLNGRLRHGNHPVLTMCAANATVVSDPVMNRKFTKTKASGRIDGMVALAMAVGTASEMHERLDAIDAIAAIG